MRNIPNFGHTLLKFPEQISKSFGWTYITLVNINTEITIYIFLKQNISINLTTSLLSTIYRSHEKVYGLSNKFYIKLNENTKEFIIHIFFIYKHKL